MTEIDEKEQAIYRKGFQRGVFACVKTLSAMLKASMKENNEGSKVD